MRRNTVGYADGWGDKVLEVLVSGGKVLWQQVINVINSIKRDRNNGDWIGELTGKARKIRGKGAGLLALIMMGKAINGTGI